MTPPRKSPASTPTPVGPTQEEEAPLEADLPGFQSPPRQPTDPPPTHHPSTGPIPLRRVTAGEEINEGGPGDRPAPSSSTTSSSPASTPEPPPDVAKLLRARKGELTKLFAQAVRMVSGLVHLFLARGDETGLWLADADDARDIGSPLASIANRHIAVRDDVETNDVIDGVSALIATGAYVEKNVERAGATRRGPEAPPPPPGAPPAEHQPYEEVEL